MWYRKLENAACVHLLLIIARAGRPVVSHHRSHCKVSDRTHCRASLSIVLRGYSTSRSFAWSGEAAQGPLPSPCTRKTTLAPGASLWASTHACVTFAGGERHGGLPVGAGDPLQRALLHVQADGESGPLGTRTMLPAAHTQWRGRARGVKSAVIPRPGCCVFVCAPETEREWWCVCVCVYSWITRM